MKFGIFNLTLFFVGSFLSAVGIADEVRIQQELADQSELIPPLQQALGKDAFDEAMASGKYSYTGNAKCRLCHRDFFLGRKEDVHDYAYKKLLNASAKNAENPRCLNCHATGAGVKGGFQSMEKTPRLANIQCEGCHGPGNVHIKRQLANMSVGKVGTKSKIVLGGFLAGTDNPALLKKMCHSCHTPRWNRAFIDFGKAYDSYKRAKPGEAP